MSFSTLHIARVEHTSPRSVVVSGSRGEQLQVQALDEDLLRVCFQPTGTRESSCVCV